MWSALEGYADRVLAFVLKFVAAWAIGIWVSLAMSSQEALKTLGIFVVFDIVTGIWAAVVNGTLSSVVGRLGLNRKVATFGLIIFVHVIEERAKMEMGLEFGGAVLYALVEIISTIENFARIGVRIPRKVYKALLIAKEFNMEFASPREIQELRKEASDASPDAASNG